MIFFVDGIWKIQFYTKIIVLENNIITDLHNVFSSLESLHNHMKNVQNIIRNTDDEYIKTKYIDRHEASAELLKDISRRASLTRFK